jgi:hypothetical protein
MASRGTNPLAPRNPHMEADARWHLDKRIPIALIVALAGQSVGAVWWARGIDSRVENLEQQAKINAPQGDRLARVEVKLEVVQEGISEIKRLIQPRR